jgi:hypothetical protein
MGEKFNFDSGLCSTTLKIARRCPLSRCVAAAHYLPQVLMFLALVHPRGRGYCVHPGGIGTVRTAGDTGIVCMCSTCIVRGVRLLSLGSPQYRAKATPVGRTATPPPCCPEPHHPRRLPPHLAPSRPHPHLYPYPPILF